MTKSRIVAWLALALCSQLCSVAFAQDMSFDLEETESAGAAGTASGGEVKAEAGGETGGSGGGDVIGDLAADDSSAQTKGDDAGPRPTEVTEEIYAVQQIYALRKNRLEILPSFGFTPNDPYVSHPNIGVGLNYWVGANVNWYQGLESESDLNFHVRRSARLAIRPVQYRFGASVNMTYVPFYGKFAMFRRYIFQWDSYIMGGVGVMQTRPKAVVDPEYRSFDYSYKVSIGNPAIGLRIFLTKWLTVFAEMRAYPYLEQYEALRVALGRSERAKPSTWTDKDSSLVWNVVTSLGMTVYLPFGFEYKKPK
jgi:outer membrane beta-barrel protein